jgi:hypothetical protein
MFNMQHMLVIDGEYSSEDGMSTRRSIRSILGRHYRVSSISSEEIVQRIVGRFNKVILSLMTGLECALMARTTMEKISMIKSAVIMEEEEHQ